MTHDADLLVHSARALDSAVWAAWRRQVTIDIRRGEPDDPLIGVVRVGTPASRMPVDIVVLLKLDAGGPGDRSDVHLMLEAWPERVAAITAHVEALLPEVRDWARQAWAMVQRELRG